MTQRAKDGFCLIYYEGKPIGEVKGMSSTPLYCIGENDRTGLWIYD
jgi:hypothetical protein